MPASRATEDPGGIPRVSPTVPSEDAHPRHAPPLQEEAQVFQQRVCQATRRRPATKVAPRPSHPARGQGAEDTEEPEETAATTRRAAPPRGLEQGADMH